jgi:hypothetical protein
VLLARATPLFEQMESWPEWIRALSCHGNALSQMGDCSRGLAEVQRARARAQEMNSLSEIALSSFCLATAYMLSGDLS